MCEADLRVRAFDRLQVTHGTVHQVLRRNPLFAGYTVLVRLSVLGGAVNSLFFYPKNVQERAVALGLSDWQTIWRRKGRFMTPFFILMAAALVLILGLWNRVTDFWPAYWQALLFQEGMNWYDGLVIDKLWVGHGKFWRIPALAGLPYVQTWPQMLKKRLLLPIIWIAAAALPVGIIVLLF